MKFQLVLPNKTNYHYAGLNANKTKHIWFDNATDLVSIHSTLKTPFDSLNTVYFAVERGQTRGDRKKETGKYLKRLILKVSELDTDLKAARLTREIIKTQFTYNKDSVIAFAAFNTDMKNYWVYYKLIKD